MAVELVTTSDCVRIVQKFYNYEDNIPIKINQIKSCGISDKLIGYLGKHERIEINYGINGKPKTLFIFLKTQTGLDTPLADYFPLLFFKELKMYEYLDAVQQLCPNQSIEMVPKFCYADSNTKTIILEDLHQLNYSMPESIVLDVLHIKKALEAVAKLHSATILYENCKSKELGRSYSITEDFADGLEEIIFSSVETTNGYAYCQAGGKGICAIIDLMPEDPDFSRETFKAEVRKLVLEMLTYLTNPNLKSCNVYAHGDLWARNMLFKYDNDVPISCQLVDYQYTRYGPPAHDVVMIIYHATDNETFKKYGQECVEYYYETLKQVLMEHKLDVATILPFQTYIKSVEQNLNYSKVIKGIYRTYTTAADEVVKEMYNDKNKFHEYMFVDRSQFCRENYLVNENYKILMCEIIHELKNVLKQRY